MKHKIMSCLFVALLVVISASDVQAGLRRWRFLGYRQTPGRVSYCGQPLAANQRSGTCYTFPTQAWDLGNRLGDWPPYSERYAR